MLTLMNAESQARLYSREQTGPKLEVLGPKIERSEEVLTPLALQLLASLHRRFNARRLELLNARARRQALLADGSLPVLLAGSAAVRRGGWHLPEKHLRINGESVSGALCDFALFLANNHEALARSGTGPYFYLPKIESHLEARLWNEVFLAAQEALGIARGTIKATVLIETVLAAFEMDEILYELREHS